MSRHEPYLRRPDPLENRLLPRLRAGVDSMTDDQTVEVVMESTGHVKFEVPISDVDRESVSLENAKRVEERVHADPHAYVRKDTGEEVDRRD